MEIICILLSVFSLLGMLSSLASLRRAKRQISGMLDALSDIKNGNGNRRILAKTDEITAPLAYEINGIVRSYEGKLSVFRQTERNNRQLMTSLSHDVRTPLTTLIGYLDAAQRGVVTGREREEYIETARRKSHELKDYIDVLFDWFRLNSDDFAMEMEEAEAAELTRKALIDWIPIFEERGIEYCVSIPERPVSVRLDPEGYARILQNLIQNMVAHSRGDRIEISLWESENHVHIRVSDNGVGIGDEDLKHIFERLYKCDRGRSERGSGLGLSIVSQLAEKMNGEITAESEPGKGAAFTLTFPSVFQ